MRERHDDDKFEFDDISLMRDDEDEDFLKQELVDEGEDDIQPRLQVNDDDDDEVGNNSTVDSFIRHYGLSYDETDGDSDLLIEDASKEESDGKWYDFFINKDTRPMTVDDQRRQKDVRKAFFWLCLGVFMMLSGSVSINRLTSAVYDVHEEINRQINEIDTAIIQGRDGTAYEVHGWIKEVEPEKDSVYRVADDELFFEKDWFKAEVVGPDALLSFGDKVIVFLYKVFAFAGSVLIGFGSFNLYNLGKEMEDK